MRDRDGNYVPDPTDVMPSPSSGNPLAAGASTTPVQVGSTAAGPLTITPDPPADFVGWVNNALDFRLGYTKAGLISAADKKTLIQKLWQDPSIQSSYVTNHTLLAAQDPSTLAMMGNLINQTMLGQGNDPSIAVDYTNMLQAAGVPLTSSEQAALAGATQSVNAPVPRPFGTNAVSGYDYGAPMPPGGWSPKAPGQSFGWDKHNGIDYGTRAGDRIVSPFAGTIHVATGVDGYGNIVYVQLDNGWTMGFGHVASGTLQNGARVNPGDLIAIAGANVGSSQGSVTLVTWQGPDAKWDKNGVLQGGFDDPHKVLDPIFAGTTFSSIGAPGAAGTGMPTVNKVLDTEYPTIKSDWQTYFGSPPSPGDVYDVLNHGSSPAQWSDYIRALPSHVDGLNQGQYYDMRQVADQVSSKVLGHPSTDWIVQELHDQQLTTPTAVTNWYNEHGVTGIPLETYQEIHKANSGTMCGIFNECGGGADPRDIKAIHDSQVQGHRSGEQVLA